MRHTPSTVARGVGQAALGAVLLTAGTAHLTTQRQEFQAQVPSWFPVDADLVVVASGIVELSLGAALLALWKQPARARLGIVVALFFVVIFPGNIAQFLEHQDGFGLDTDLKRGVRLIFQPLLVLWALWAASSWAPIRRARAADPQ